MQHIPFPTGNLIEITPKVMNDEEETVFTSWRSALESLESAGLADVFVKFGEKVGFDGDVFKYICSTSERLENALYEDGTVDVDRGDEPGDLYRVGDAGLGALHIEDTVYNEKLGIVNVVYNLEYIPTEFQRGYLRGVYAFEDGGYIVLTVSDLNNDTSYYVNITFYTGEEDKSGKQSELILANNQIITICRYT